ncbi:MAG: mannosyltransferase family protein [Dokdonella sp.]
MTGTSRNWLHRIDGFAVAGILGLFVFSRVALILIGALTQATLGDGTIRHLINLGCRWDCGWYLGIARHGYTMDPAIDTPGATAYAFFPVFPMMVRGIAAVTGLGLEQAGMLISNLCFVAILAYLYRYVLLLGYSRSVAMLSVALLCIAPQTFVFSAVYTESVFVLLLVAAMFHLRREHYMLAGVAAALLSATRANGVFFIVFALAWTIQRFGWRSLLHPWQQAEAYIPILLAPLGLFAWWGYCWWATGDAFAQVTTVGHGWGWFGGFFLENLWWYLQGSPESLFWTISTLCLFAASFLLLRMRLYAELAFCIAVFVLTWSGGVAHSMLRYTMVLFPIWIAIARHIEGRPAWTAGVIGILAMFNGFLMVQWTLGKLLAI